MRRLRIQQRIKNAELGIFNEEQENELPNFPSFIPFLPPLVSFLNYLHHAFNYCSYLSCYCYSWASTIYFSHILFADFSKPQAVLCNLFFSYCRNNSFWWSPCTQCKIFSTKFLFLSCLFPLQFSYLEVIDCVYFSCQDESNPLNWRKKCTVT